MKTWEDFESRKAKLDLNLIISYATVNPSMFFLSFSASIFNTSRHHIITIRKQLLRSAIAKHSKEHWKLIHAREKINYSSSKYPEKCWFLHSKTHIHYITMLLIKSNCTIYQDTPEESSVLVGTVLNPWVSSSMKQLATFPWIGW